MSTNINNVAYSALNMYAVLASSGITTVINLLAYVIHDGDERFF